MTSYISFVPSSANTSIFAEVLGSVVAILSVVEDFTAKLPFIEIDALLSTNSPFSLTLSSFPTLTVALLLINSIVFHTKTPFSLVSTLAISPTLLDNLFTIIIYCSDVPSSAVISTYILFSSSGVVTLAVCFSSVFSELLILTKDVFLLAVTSTFTSVVNCFTLTW